jgi:hypothetical protein
LNLKARLCYEQSRGKEEKMEEPKEKNEHKSLNEDEKVERGIKKYFRKLAQPEENGKNETERKELTVLLNDFFNLERPDHFAFKIPLSKELAELATEMVELYRKTQQLLKQLEENDCQWLREEVEFFHQLLAQQVRSYGQRTNMLQNLGWPLERIKLEMENLWQEMKKDFISAEKEISFLAKVEESQRYFFQTMLDFEKEDAWYKPLAAEHRICLGKILEKAREQAAQVLMETKDEITIRENWQRIWTKADEKIDTMKENFWKKARQYSDPDPRIPWEVTAEGQRRPKNVIFLPSFHLVQVLLIILIAKICGYLPISSVLDFWIGVLLNLIIVVGVGIFLDKRRWFFPKFYLGTALFIQFFFTMFGLAFMNFPLQF